MTERSTLEVGLLGPLELRRDGVVLPTPARQQRVLLTRLALDAGRVVSVDALLDAVWGEQLPANPANALQWQVGKLRRIVGADAIATSGVGYALRVDPARLDVACVEAAADQGLALHRLGDHHAAVQLAAETLDLWRGEALADCRDFDFAQPAIARLDDTRVALRQLRLAAELELGRAESAVPQLQALSREHPDREEVWRLLMLGLYRAGRQADALDAFRTARDRLDETIGVEPSAALRGLYTAILNQDPTLDAEPASPPAAAVPLPPSAADAGHAAGGTRR